MPLNYVYREAYGVQTTIYFCMESPAGTSSDVFIAGAPFAVGDVKIHKDGGAVANTTNLPVVLGGVGAFAFGLVLTAAEMSAEDIDVVVHDAAGAAFRDVHLHVKTITRQGRIVVDATQIGGNTSAIEATGVGSKAGIAAVGGATGDGVTCSGGGTSLSSGAGHGIFASTSVSGAHGVNAVGSGAGNGLAATGGASGNGASFAGLGAAHGVLSTGGPTSGSGIKAVGVGAGGIGIWGLGGGIGLKAEGQGAGVGTMVLGGATAGTIGLTIGTQNATGRGVYVNTIGPGVEIACTGAFTAVTIANSSTGGGLSVTAAAATAVNVNGGTGTGVAVVGNAFGVQVTAGVAGTGVDINGGDGGEGVNISSGGGGNGPGVVIRGAGNGIGVDIATGAAGRGVQVLGSGANAVLLQSSGAAAALNLVGDTGQGLAVGNNAAVAALAVTNSGAGLGLLVSGGAGIQVISTAGDAVQLLATGGRGAFVRADTAGNNVGLSIQGGGTQPAVLGIGGGSGNGITLQAGIAGVSGISVSAVAVNAVGIRVAAALGVGVLVTAGVDGISADGAAGVGLKVSGNTGMTSVGSVAYGIYAQSAGVFPGVLIQAAGTGAGVRIGAGTGGVGVDVAGNGGGAGVQVAAGATGIGIDVSAAGATAIRAVGGGNGHGLGLLGAGTGFGLSAVGGADTFGDINGVLDDHVLNTGTAQAADATHVTLDAVSASGLDDYYTGAAVAIYAGTGAGQAREITGYVGATKVAAVSGWVTQPDITSKYIVIPQAGGGGGGGLTAAQVWAYAEGAEPTSAIPNNATVLEILQHLKRFHFNRVTATNNLLRIYRDNSSTSLETAVRDFNKITAERRKYT